MPDTVASPVEPARPSPAPRRRRIVVGLLLGFILLAGAGATAGYLAFVNKDRADDWEARALELDRNVAELEAALLERTDQLNARTEELNAMSAKVLDAEEAIGRSEADVRSLERRQRQLANEKAQVEDARAALEVQTDAIANVASAFITCKEGLVELLNYVLAEDYATASAVYPRIDGYCDTADNALNGYLARHGD
jgi:septal ring factor EnvC (AmiA/AmiB activator)